MTDFEQALLFSEYLNTANLVFSNYMAVTFAMLTASYFLAHRMGGWVAALFLILYTVGAMLSGSGVLFAFTDFFNLGVHIHEQASQNPGALGWLGPAGPGGAAMASMPMMVGIMLLVSYVGSIGFFFVVRHNRILAEGKPDARDDPAADEAAE
ncbi:hypothetical protein [Maricaulis sp.]|uniref:hypothetical protein n=1 Tax=Maricaulis sp. TaxID=1486257 RepID=UPI003A9495AB